MLTANMEGGSSFLGEFDEVRSFLDISTLDMKIVNHVQEKELNPSPVSATTKAERISKAVAEILACIDPEAKREGLVDTPNRCAKSLLYLTSGYEQNLNNVCNNALFSGGGDGLVIVKDIEVQSICEHHLVPFTGKISVGYVPNGKVLGLSKVARIVDMYARRLQIQERITKQVAEALEEVLQPKAVGVVMEASHLCMVMRGVQKTNSSTRTHTFLGSLKDDVALRQEFFHAL